MAATDGTYITINTTTEGVDIDGPLTVDGGVEVDGTLDVSDDITAFATLSSSDSRLKQDIEAINSGNALEQVNSLQGVYFKYKEKPEDTNIGFIAQEVLDVVPEVVRTGSEGYYSLNYANLTALLVEAVKELSKKIENLESK